MRMLVLKITTWNLKLLLMLGVLRRESCTCSMCCLKINFPMCLLFVKIIILVGNIVYFVILSDIYLLSAIQ